MPYLWPISLSYCSPTRAERNCLACRGSRSRCPPLETGRPASTIHSKVKQYYNPFVQSVNKQRITKEIHFGIIFKCSMYVWTFLECWTIRLSRVRLIYLYVGKKYQIYLVLYEWIVLFLYSGASSIGTVKPWYRARLVATGAPGVRSAHSQPCCNSRWTTGNILLFTYLY